MTVRDLMSNLEEVSAGNPDLEVEVRVVTGTRKITSELLEDVSDGEKILIETCFDEYIEDISIEKSEYGGKEKICILADAG